jgi:putative NADH-flavin reductase
MPGNHGRHLPQKTVSRGKNTKAIIAMTLEAAEARNVEVKRTDIKKAEQLRKLLRFG